MATLLDALRKQRASLLQPQGITDQSTQAQQLARARSGKQLGPSDVAPSAIGEQVAVGEANRQLQTEVAPALQAQQQAQELQAAETEQREQQATAEIVQGRKFTGLRQKMQLNQLMGELEREKGQLNLERNQAKLDQVGTLLALQDATYVRDLENIGRQRRLDDVANSRNELTNLVFGNSIALLRTKLGGIDALESNKRQFREALSAMDLDTAVKLAEINKQHREQMYGQLLGGMKQSASIGAAAARAGQLYGGGLGVLQAGIGGFEKSAAQEERDKEAAERAEMLKYIRKQP